MEYVTEYNGIERFLAQIVTKCAVAKCLRAVLVAGVSSPGGAAMDQRMGIQTRLLPTPIGYRSDQPMQG
jgi:hypothetical protein